MKEGVPMGGEIHNEMLSRALPQVAKSLIGRIAKEGELCGAGTGSGSATWGHGAPLRKLSPIDLQPITVVRSASMQDYREIMDQAAAAFSVWRMVPAPKRGEVVRQIAEVLRRHKKELAEVVSREVGKIRAEAEGEVQEMIDMAEKSSTAARRCRAAFSTPGLT